MSNFKQNKNDVLKMYGFFPPKLRLKQVMTDAK